MTKMSLSKVDFNSLLADFRNLNPNDPGAWPLAPRVVIWVLLFAAIVATGWFFDWQDQIDALAQAEQRELELRDEWVNKKRQAVNLELYRKQLSEIDRSFGALLKQLPNRNEMESLLVEINQAGLGRGLAFELFKPSGEQMKEFYAELPITLKITGSYHDVGAFASDIAQLSRIVTLGNLGLTVARGQRLTLEATARTYRYLDQEEIAAQRRAQQEAKKGRRRR